VQRAQRLCVEQPADTRTSLAASLTPSFAQVKVGGYAGYTDVNRSTPGQLRFYLHCFELSQLIRRSKAAAVRIQQRWRDSRPAQA